ncbi:hypothetical protein P691DRAFT_125279 [Macrolepiota fuliginosa MF-IS2]|uniref:Six-hairpin glycosidase-like protein n=1 Tax=Macrolepiota fuliginosa MF-IS2 TaxID=1400762 RepID=A0A9P6C3D2_9AGAR|nr:hypothetical protein P691DRAFT_125279 [Macrolepiota fuliginosa MF-IS2]
MKLARPISFLSLGLQTLATSQSNDKINRHDLVTRYNPIRTSSDPTTPIQVGNGNFAFGADVTGLQTFLPFNTLSSWGWKNDSLPAGITQADIEAYKGVSWLNHGRPVQYDFGGGNPIEQWLISNPNRVNLGRIGLAFLDGTSSTKNVTESDLQNIKQTLDLWSGTITSEFSLENTPVKITVASGDTTDTIAIQLDSPLLKNGQLGAFLDFPWCDGIAKFSAPFVGRYDVPANHTTTLHTSSPALASIQHDLDSATFTTTVVGDAYSIKRENPNAHRYIVSPQPKASTTTWSVAVTFGLSEAKPARSAGEIFEESTKTWGDYWSSNGFVDVLTGSTDPRANELQRRIILSRYLMRVNEAGDTPPQESGLVNNGWYGKFHMEMYFWHSAHWGLWNNWEILRRSSSIYDRFLPSSLARSQIQQGWSQGARWPKMTDPTGRSAPGEINNLLIWQQPHPLIFAEYEYRSFPTTETLEKWEAVVRETANWMTAFAWFNDSTSVYDLGPPMFVVSEDTSPNVTQNPAFELAYWRLGLGIAEKWMNGLGKAVPQSWIDVKNNLAKLPIDNGTYMVYEGIEKNFWDDPAYTSDHPALVGLHGWLAPTEGLDPTIAKVTAEKVWTHWNATDFWGWDYPMLAMSAARNGELDRAIDWLLDPLYQFDDVGMPIGGVRVPTPYFPGSGSFLLAIAMMAAGWDGGEGKSPGFPQGWNVKFEAINKAL